MLRCSAAAVGSLEDLASDVCNRHLRTLLDDSDRKLIPEIHIASDVEGGDSAIQAISGMMEVHGRDVGAPRRLGLDIPSVAAGIFAAQAAMAAAFARLRGIPVTAASTSLTTGALAFLQHHLALATCGNDLPFQQPPLAPGPPFRTRDGQLIEIEALLGADWVRFWSQMDVSESVAGGAWLPFVFRFLTGYCSLPSSLHDAIARRSWAEVREGARTAGVSACRVRAHAEVLSDEGPDAARAPWLIRETDGPGRVSRAARGPTRTSAPLADTRVVEVTSRMQGPLATQLLRQLGAEVIKVEPPGGDFGRKAVPRAGRVGAAYLAYNREKTRVELDYKRPADRDRLLELIADADVFLHNWPRGRAEALGLDPSTLRNVNPALVCAHAAGWRNDNPPCTIASDFLVQAHAACGDALYPAAEVSRPSRLTLIDVAGGLLACEGVLAGLLRRERSGRGQYVETSLFEAAMSLQRHAPSGRLQWDVLDQPLAAADQYVFAGPLNLAMRKRLADVCGVADAANSDVIARQIGKKSAAHWVEVLPPAGVPAVTVCTDLRQLPNNPLTVKWMERADDACWVPAAPWHFSV
jgi:crotonobetainyl-CoA:carnitine CoA-transferase CaiB-like acyl-CoA transferase